MAVVVCVAVFGVVSLIGVRWVVRGRARGRWSIMDIDESGAGAGDSTSPEFTTIGEAADLSVLAIVADSSEPIAVGLGSSQSAHSTVDPLARLRMWRDFQLQAKRLQKSDPWRSPNQKGQTTTDKHVTVAGSTETEPGCPTLVLLGQITVTGMERPLTVQQTALVTLLMLRGPLSKEQLVDALWAGRAVSSSRFANLIAEVRSILGRDRLVYEPGGRYRVENVRSDVEVLQRSADVVSEETEFGDDAASRLMGAVEQITGTVLGRNGSKYWHWLDDDYHHSARLQQLVVDAALRLSEVAERGGQLTKAQWACDQGLIAVPTNEALIGRLAELFAVQGHRRIAGTLADQAGGERPSV